MFNTWFPPFTKSIYVHFFLNFQLIIIYYFIVKLLWIHLLSDETRLLLFNQGRLFTPFTFIDSFQLLLASFGHQSPCQFQVINNFPQHTKYPNWISIWLMSSVFYRFITPATQRYNVNHTKLLISFNWHWILLHQKLLEPIPS